jgi:GMP synthase (glutamine-hydrolysing)
MKLDIEDPEQKRKIMGNTFINVFGAEAAKIEAAADEGKNGAPVKGRVGWLLQGML